MTGSTKKPDYSGLSAVFMNCTLTPSPKESHPDTLMDVVRKIMTGAGVSVQSFRAVDDNIAPGVHPDMTEHGFKTDAWPDIGKAVLAEDRQGMAFRCGVDRLSRRGPQRRPRA